MVSSTPRPCFTPGKDPVPIVQEAGWASGPVWTGGKSRPPTGIRSPDRPARSQSLYPLSYPAHIILLYNYIILWDHRRICGTSLTETSLRGAYLASLQLLSPTQFYYTVSLYQCPHLAPCNFGHKTPCRVTLLHRTIISPCVTP